MVDPGSRNKPARRWGGARAAGSARGATARWASCAARRFIDHSKDTQFTDAWIILAVILTIVGLITRNSFLLAGAGALLVSPLLAAAWNRLALFGVDYTRKLSETRAFLGETVELTLEVRNRKFLPVTWLHVIDAFPANLPVAGHEVRMNAATNQGEFLSFWNPGVFRPADPALQGPVQQAGLLHLRSRNAERLAMGSACSHGAAPCPGQQRLIVYPRLYPAEALRLPAKNPFGERTADARLVEDPLRTAGIRDWQPEDGLKRVHWKATARHQALLSRQYEPTQEPQVLIFLNVATLERHWLGHIPELMERAVSVAGSLAQVCADERLPVGLIANGVLPGSDQPLAPAARPQPGTARAHPGTVGGRDSVCVYPDRGPAAARVTAAALGRHAARGHRHRTRRVARRAARPAPGRTQGPVIHPGRGAARAAAARDHGLSLAAPGGRRHRAAGGVGERSGAAGKSPDRSPPPPSRRHAGLVDQPRFSSSCGPCL